MPTATTAERTPLLAADTTPDQTAPQATPTHRPEHSQHYDAPIPLGIFNTIALFRSVLLLLLCTFYAAVGVWLIFFGAFMPGGDLIR